jgi:DNA mismatch repair protein MutL
LLPVARFRDLRVLGQVDQTYIVCEGAGELVIIDQHAAHERVRLHQLQSNRDEHLGRPQRLLTPMAIDLPRGRAELLLDRADALSSLHLEVEPMGSGQVALTGVPPLLAKADLTKLLVDLADSLADDGVAGGEGEDVVSYLLATMACHSAIRAHDPLTLYEMQRLLASLDEVDFEVCAHGRPVAIRLSTTELERRFHRS